MPFIDQQEILNKSNGGLNIILQLYPEAQKALDKTNEKFKIRPDEKTASASIKKLEDGTYVVTDWGGDAKPKNAVVLFMEHERVTYRQALEILAERFSISGQKNAVHLKPDYEKRAPEEEEELGQFYFTPREANESELAVIGPNVTQELITKYNLWAVQEYRYIRKDKTTGKPVAHCFKSTEHYPIFIFNMDGWKKRMEPLNPDKGKRFLYDGERPKDFIFGLTQCQKAYDKLNAAREEDDHTEQRLPEIIICSGDRDALNVASMGYHVVWMNSESAKLSIKQFNKLKSLAEKVFNVPDLDATGVKQGHALAMEHLDIHTIRLPWQLLQKKDFRGNPCKDVRDYMKYYSKWHFKKLVETALPYRLWDEWWNTKQNKMEYRFNNAQSYNFLQHNGYHRFDHPNSKTGYIYIKIEGNVVSEVNPVKIKSYIYQFLKERKVRPELLNTFFRAQNQLGENSLSNLDVTEIDFTDCDRDRQFIFFQNTTWEITKNGIEEHLPGSSKKFVWEDEVIKRDATQLDPPFTVAYNPDTDRYELEIHRKECLFLQYLWNASRMHWRKEDEEGKELTEDEKYEQELHFINKVYSLGYLMHRYKDPSRPWCVFAMDNKISETGESHGGTGKSICYKSPRYFMKYVTLEGRNPKLTENPHIYENVSTHTDYLLVDDANQYLKFDFFFSAITGEMIVNPKHGKQFELQFDEVPKFCITSNFTLRNIDPSTERRLLYTVFSDYYHYNKDGEYQESRSPYDDFGKNLFIDFTDEEWNQCFNTIAACIQTYLRFPKIDPPMDNVEKRNLRTVITEPFKDWADIYFSKENDHTDRLIVKDIALDDFRLHNRNNKMTAGRLKNSLKAWCKYYGYVFNPDSLINEKDAGRIIKKYQGKATEYIYIKAYKDELNDEHDTGVLDLNQEEDPYDTNDH